VEPKPHSPHHLADLKTSHSRSGEAPRGLAVDLPRLELPRDTRRSNLERRKLCMRPGECLLDIDHQLGLSEMAGEVGKSTSRLILHMGSTRHKNKVYF
jgi:hypothetical protein